MKKINLILGIIIILENVYFVQLTIIIVKTYGGPMGFGLLLMPFLILIHLFLIPAFFVLINKYRESKILLFINIIGVISLSFMLWLFTTTPYLD